MNFLGVSICWLLRKHRFGKPQNAYRVIKAEALVGEVAGKMIRQKTCKRCGLTVEVRKRKRNDAESAFFAEALALTADAVEEQSKERKR